MSGTVLRHVEVNGAVADVRIDGTAITAMGDAVPVGPGDRVIDGGGGALLPGLHDHHLHLLAMAAAGRSVPVGPPEVRDGAQFARILRQAASALPSGGWVRGIGYHESVAGELDRDSLDTIVSDRSVRIQHRSGALWTLNSCALRELQIASATGRLYGADQWLRGRMGAVAAPPLAPVGEELARYGISGVTDATPSRDLSAMRLLGRAVASGALPQTVVVTGGPELAPSPGVEGVRWGPVKFVIGDHALPSLDAARGAVATAHGHGRPIAIHCVTAAAIALALASWRDAGVREGDRIEHGAVISPDAAVQIAELGVAVVTQPGFIATRGDQYLTEVEAIDLPDLYRCRSLIEHGIHVGGSSDAPFGHPDPWAAIRAAIERRTGSGAILGPGERLEARRALALFLGPPERPGGPTRRIGVGVEADLCLLDRPLDVALADPSSGHVAATVIRGEVVHRAG